MTEFIFKSSVCLLVFLSFYYLVLEREKMHHFNRLYLIGSLIVSFIIPFFTYEIIEIVPSKMNQITIIPQSETIVVETINNINYIPIVMWTIYFIITSVFLFRFGKNIWKLIQKSNSNKAVNYKNATLILVKEKILPHSFFNFIFINTDDYNNRTIEDELYTHELVHVTQKHTLDILFIELLKFIFWFNPIFYLYKKAIQLNHEFLADEKVVTSYNNVTLYQNLLLEKSSNVQTIYLASNLNYLVTKKRLIMMTKNTSKNVALFKKLAIAPILVGLIFLFCIKTVAQEKKINVKTSTSKSKISNSYNDSTAIEFRNKEGEILGEKKYVKLNEKQKISIPPPPPPQRSGISKSSDKRIIEVQDMKSISNLDNSNAEKVETISENKNSVTEIKPEFPGGQSKFDEYIRSSIKFSDEDKNLDGRIIVSFYIETDGTVSDISILRGISENTSQEVVKLMENSPKWIPGKIDDVNAKMRYVKPILIRFKSK